MDVEKSLEKTLPSYTHMHLKSEDPHSLDSPICHEIHCCPNEIYTAPVEDLASVASLLRRWL